MMADKDVTAPNAQLPGQGAAVPGEKQPGEGTGASESGAPKGPDAAAPAGEEKSAAVREEGAAAAHEAAAARAGEENAAPVSNRALEPARESATASSGNGSPAPARETMADRMAEAFEQPAHEPELPRGATPSELDALRASIKVSPRGQPVPPPPRASAPPPPLAHAMMHRSEIDRIIDDGRALLEKDVKAAHEIFTRAWRRNLNDPRVLSNFGLTLVLVEGDRQRGIRFCEEALRRGLQTTETLVNLARALVVTRNKEQAVRALRKAMDLAPDDPRVGAEFAALGLRRTPPIPFLPRSFFLNRWLGKLTWRWSKRYRLDPLGR